MGDIGIGIRVNTSQVVSAQKELRELLKLQQQADGGSESAGQARTAGDNMRDGGIDVSAARNLEGSSKRTGAALEGWQKSAKQFRTEIQQIVKDLSGLEKASHDLSMSPKHRGMIMSEIQGLTARRGELQKRVDRADRNAETLQSRMPDGMTSTGVTMRYGVFGNSLSRFLSPHLSA